MLAIFKYVINILSFFVSDFLTCDIHPGGVEPALPREHIFPDEHRSCMMIYTSQDNYGKLVPGSATNTINLWTWGRFNVGLMVCNRIYSWPSGLWSYCLVDELLCCSVQHGQILYFKSTWLRWIILSYVQISILETKWCYRTYSIQWRQFSLNTTNLTHILLS